MQSQQAAFGHASTYLAPKAGMTFLSPSEQMIQSTSRHQGIAGAANEDLQRDPSAVTSVDSRIAAAIIAAPIRIGIDVMEPV